MNIMDKKNIMVYVEINEKSPINVSLEALTQATKTAKEISGQVIAVLIGEELDAAAKECIEFGADEVICVENKNKNIEFLGKSLTQLVQKYNPNMIFIGASSDGKDLGSIIASQIGVSALTDVIGMRYDSEKWIITTPMYSGNILREVVVPEEKTSIIILRSGVCKKEYVAKKTGNILKETVEEKKLLTKILDVVKEISENVNLEEAEVIVTGGRGMGSKENFELVKQLAKICGGVVGATRPVTEENWIPRTHQIGQSGKIVAPKLYIACGVSGATQHISGITSSKYIVAINKDEEAPIFEIADIGIVANVMDILPIMIEEIKKIKSK